MTFPGHYGHRAAIRALAIVSIELAVVKAHRIKTAFFHGGHVAAEAVCWAGEHSNPQKLCCPSHRGRNAATTAAAT